MEFEENYSGEYEQYQDPEQQYQGQEQHYHQGQDNEQQYEENIGGDRGQFLKLVFQAFQCLNVHYFHCSRFVH